MNRRNRNKNINTKNNDDIVHTVINDNNTKNHNNDNRNNDNCNNANHNTDNYNNDNRNNDNRNNDNRNNDNRNNDNHNNNNNNNNNNYNKLHSYLFAPKKTVIKIALVGDGSIGKTSYFSRIVTRDDPGYEFN